MKGALQVSSHTFSKAIDQLPKQQQKAICRGFDAKGFHLADLRHQRFQGRSECKLRMGDYRVLYQFDISNGRVDLLYVGHRREIYRR